MPDSPFSIVVMPFQNLSTDQEAGYFARGFVGDLIADLTRFPDLRVMAGHSSFELAGMDKPAEETAREWGADYLLTGSVRRGGDALRVTTQLLRAVGKEVVWAERFDATLQSVFDIQDAITATVAGKLAVHVGDERLERARACSLDELQAYDCWVRGLDYLRRGTLEDDAESRQYFERALEIDPEYARAYSGLAISHFNEWTCQAWHLFDESADGAFRFARRAAELGSGDPMVQAVLARIHRFRHEHAEADQHAARALALNPNDAHVLIHVAIATLFSGEPEAAHALATKAIDLNPLHGAWYGGVAGWSSFLAGDTAAALRLLDEAGDAIVNFAAYRAACHALLGDHAAATRAYAEFEREYQDKIAFGRAPAPNEALRWAVQAEPSRRLQDSRRMPEALRAAGIAAVDVQAARAERPRTMVRPAGIQSPLGSTFRPEGDVWVVQFEGTGARLVGLKGFHDIARLLCEPEVPIHCLELSGAPPAREAAHDVLDAEARGNYRRRIEELQADLERAENDNDVGEADRTRAELDAVIDELGRASGLGGRSRNLDQRVERARTATTWRIRSAIKKVKAAHPRLGQHLGNCIRTGTFCSYSPEGEIEWSL